MEGTISVLIVEDELIWQKHLEIHLKNLGYKLAATFNNIEDSVLNLNKIPFDIALVDININGRNSGIDLGKIIKTNFNKPFVFVTSSIDKQTISEALDASPSAYLIKPITEASLYASIQTAISNFENNTTASSEKPNTDTDAFFIKIGTKYKKIDWADVLALSVSGRYTKLLLKNDASDYLVSSSLSKTIDTIVPNIFKDQFAQISRNEYVNVFQITDLNASQLKIDKYAFSISENYLKQLKEKMNIAS